MPCPCTMPLTLWGKSCYENWNWTIWYMQAIVQCIFFFFFFFFLHRTHRISLIWSNWVKVTRTMIARRGRQKVHFLPQNGKRFCLFVCLFFSNRREFSSKHPLFIPLFERSMPLLGIQHPVKKKKKMKNEKSLLGAWKSHFVDRYKWE